MKTIKSISSKNNKSLREIAIELEDYMNSKQSLKPCMKDLIDAANFVPEDFQFAIKHPDNGIEIDAVDLIIDFDNKKIILSVGD